MEKVCAVCTRELPLDQFFRKGKGRHSYCKQCATDRVRVLRAYRREMFAAARRVWAAFLAYGPVDDGRPEGDEFDTALVDLQALTELASGDGLPAKATDE